MDPLLRRRRYVTGYVILATVFAVVLVLTNIIGTKLFLLMPELLSGGFGALTANSFVVLTTGIITYPLTFLITDVVSEVWGRQRANLMVWLGFACSVLMLVVVAIAVHLPRADRYWEDPSGQYAHGTHLTTGTADGASTLAVDDLRSIGLAAGGPVLVAVPAHDSSYDVRKGPKPPTFIEATPGHSGPGRWDGLGEIELSTPLASPLAAGQALLPAARLAAPVTIGGEAGTEQAVVRLDRPLPLPPVGTLLATNGLLLDFVVLPDGALRLSQQWQSAAYLGEADLELAAGSAVAVAGRLDPTAMQGAFTAAFAAPLVLLAASMAAYLIAQLLDVFLYHYWRRRTGQRHLWLRNNGSTLGSQLVDTAVVNGIFLPIAFGMGFEATVMVIGANYIVKAVLAAIDTPFIYLGVYLAKRWLGYAWTDEVPDLLGPETPAG